MSLMRRSRPESFFPEWFPRNLIDLTDPFPSMLDEERMRVEEFQEDGTLVVRAEMPGIDPDEDVEITVSDGMLHLKAERTEETKTEDTKGYRTEFRYGSFSRSVRLPAGATEEDIAASYQDGILEVRIPISSEQASARKIPIGRGKN